MSSLNAVHWKCEITIAIFTAEYYKKNMHSQCLSLLNLTLQVSWSRSTIFSYIFFSYLLIYLFIWLFFFFFSLQCLPIILDNKLSHPLLEQLLPAVRHSLHDNSEKVRVAFVDMLLKVKTVKAAKVG